MIDTKRDVIESWVRRNIRMSFSRSSGPGGQNVNKLNTKVTAWVDISSLDILEEQEREAVESHLSSRISGRGELVVRVQDTRSQAQNSELAVSRITDIIEGALKTKKKRHSTRPTLRSKEERIRAKKILAQKKRLRSRVTDGETGGGG